MFSDPTLAIVNIIMIVGIIGAILASVKLNRGNKELHAKNQAKRREVYRHSEG